MVDVDDLAALVPPSAGHGRPRLRTLDVEIDRVERAADALIQDILADA